VREDVKTRKLRYVHLSSDRPAWTGLVDLLSPVAGAARPTGWVVHAAPVVQQWYESLRERPASLVVFDIGTTKRDRATPASRVCEAFPLSTRLADRDVADAVRAGVADAERGLDALRAACVRLHMKGEPKTGQQRQRARAEEERLADVTASFWQRTEPAFWAAYEAFVGEADDAQAEAQEKLGRTIRKTALDIFDAWGSPSLGDASRVAVIARVRARLVRDLPRSQRAREAPGEHAA